MDCLGGNPTILESELSRNIPSLAQSIAQTFRGSPRYYLSDVLACGNARECEGLYNIIAHEIHNFGSGCTDRTLFLVSRHGDHIHIIHDCAYSNRACRCQFFQKAEIRRHLRRSIRGRVPISDLTGTDWINIITYFSTEGRRLGYLIHRGKMVYVSNANENLDVGETSGDSTERLLESCDEGNCAELQRETPVKSIDRPGRRSRDKTRKRARSDQEGTHEKIERTIFQNPCCPLDGIINHPIWLNDPDLKYIRKDNYILKEVLDALAHKLCSWSIYDFHEMYSAPDCNPCFTAVYVDVDQRYMSLEKSLEVIDRLLLFQFDNSPEEVKAFLIDFYNILERRYPKKNSICVRSPPNGGKNFFFDCFLNYYLNRGQFHSVANKTNHFAFQDAYGKRVILWNEPNYEGCLTDLLKTILGGDDYTVAVKNKGDAACYKTPVIILTNSVVNFMVNTAFTERISQYSWNSADFLVEYNLKPNPLVAFEIMKKYDIVSV